MRINSKSIKCDFCGTIYTDDFMYYSCDAREITVYVSNRQSIDNCLLEPIVKSNEMCATCYGNICKKIVQINSKEIRPSRSIRNYDLCELTGLHLKGDYKYYYVILDRVDVKGTNNYICTKCKQHHDGKPSLTCKCGNSTFINPSKVSVQNRQLEFRTQIKPYQDLLVNIDKNNNWSTST